MNNQQLYFDGSLLVDEDLPNLCADFKIPFTDLISAVEQIRRDGEPSYALYGGTVRERVREFFSHVSSTGVQEEGSPPVVAHSEAPAIQAPPVPYPVAKDEDLEESDDEETLPAPFEERDEIVGNATTSLIQAMTLGEGHFIITADGHCTINKESPPTLVHSYQVLESSMKLDQLGEKVTDAAAWLQGDLIMSLEEFFGEDFNVSQVCEINTAAYNTIITRLSVCKAFKGKRFNLSFSAHKEAFHCKIPHKSKLIILRKAETYRLTTKHIRGLGSVRKKMDDDTVIKRIRSKEQVIDLIAGYKQASERYYVYEDGQWMDILGFVGQLPMRSGKDEPADHYPVVLGTKSKVAYANGVKQGDIVKKKLRKD